MPLALILTLIDPNPIRYPDLGVPFEIEMDPNDPNSWALAVVTDELTQDTRS